MITRRQFCKAVGAGAVSAGLPQLSLAWSDPSPFRATPNPSSEHFTIEDAKRCVANWSPDDPVRTQCLELTLYKTISLDALAVLADREWLIVDFGLTEITEEIARAISVIRIEFMHLHHLEHASSGVVAILTSIPSKVIGFEEVESLSEDGIFRLVDTLHSMKSSDNLMSIQGDFLLNRFGARALVSIPMDISLLPIRERQAFTQEAWSEFSTCRLRGLDVWISPNSFSVHSDYGKCSLPIIERWDDALGEIINIPFDTAYL